MARILGIKLNAVTLPEALEKSREFLADSRPHYIVTPNPEILLTAWDDEELFHILNKADLSLADGFGLKIAGLLDSQSIKRLTGADLAPALLGLAQNQRIKTAILNWAGGLSKAEEIRATLVEKYPGLPILVLDTGRESLDEAAAKRLADFAPRLLFVTFGCPYQEKFIFHHLHTWPSLRLGIGVGGAFDFLTEKAKRAGAAWQYLGLEWLWRLLKQPKRYKRIYNATFVFLGRFLRARFINHFSYRPNVACLLYKRTEGGLKVLLVERSDEPGHWQLPQGGTEGEDLATAGRRELAEETGALRIIPRGTFKNLHRYAFQEEIGDFEDRRIFKDNYKGQKQGLFVAEFVGEDSDLRINFWDHRAWRWVALEDFVSAVHPIRQKAARIFLEKFQSLNIV